MMKLFVANLDSYFLFCRDRRRRRCDSTPCSWVWNTCSRTCGGGTQSPRITRQKGSCGSCNLPSARSCNSHCCPVNCAWRWNNWGACSATCGGGRSTRTRYYVRRASCGGSSCQGPSTETRSCNNRCCPVNCRGGGWNNWGDCSQSCAGGRQTRIRSIATQPACGGTGCQGSHSESQSCNNHCCRIDCVWGGWSNWGVCSQTCAGGHQTRTRSFATRPTCGGARCQGSNTELQSCNNHCCRIDCKWGGWSNWGVCSLSCAGGRQARTRSFATQPTCGGAKCHGSNTELQSCNTHCCRIDCKWGEWMTWGSCSLSCAGGSRTRTRYVDIQPRCSGTSCQGLAIDFQSCNTGCCPQHCQWGRWAVFGTCSATCGPGIQFLRRKSIKEPTCAGACLGSKFNVISCNREMCSSNEW